MSKKKTPDPLSKAGKVGGHIGEISQALHEDHKESMAMN